MNENVSHRLSVNFLKLTWLQIKNASPASPSIRGVCAYLGNLSRHNTPNKYQPCPVPAHGSGCGALLRYNRKRKKTESDLLAGRELQNADDEPPQAKTKPKSSSLDKEPCFCSAKIASAGINNNRQRILRRKRAKSKTPDTKIPVRITDETINTECRKPPETTAAVPAPSPPAVSHREAFRKDRRRDLSSLVKSVVKRTDEPVWRSVIGQKTLIGNEVNPSSKASAARHNVKNIMGLTSDHENRGNKLSKNKIVKVLWHATNYKDPD
ncbi:uncharacterized protein LOC105688121 isoform X2 [Athalia rosae]|uniref:uncharacterized protein LOC105688121 isoform X2 n=1 Tax=Athalia rosae TaxID=37344 RepID=UPI00203408D5|nr:uncharacterized protein LOC105688121 isoform X2 [Athalia rosae]